MAGFSKNNEKKIDQVFYEFLRAYGISRKYDEYKLKNEWENVVGQTIARQTDSLSIDKETLYVRLSSPSLRQEMGYAKSHIIESLNDAVGKVLIRDIMFM